MLIYENVDTDRYLTYRDESTNRICKIKLDDNIITINYLCNIKWNDHPDHEKKEFQDMNIMKINFIIKCRCS